MSSRVLLPLCLALCWTVLAAEDIQSSPSLRSSAPSSAGGSAEAAAAAAQVMPPQSMDEDRAKAGAEASGKDDSSESAAFVAAGLPDARTLFKQTDANGDGYLSRGEVRAAMRRHGIRLAASDFNAKFRKADSNGDGRISWGEASRAFVAYRR